MRALLVLLVLLPLAAAHGAEHLDPALVANGEAVMVGRFDAPQRGPLVVVPHVDGPLGCAAPPQDEYRIPMGADAGLMMRANATALEALFDLPANATGYAGFAVDTRDATRALIFMQENAVALHALASVVLRANGTEMRTGVLGVPYPVAAAAHAMALEPDILMDHDGSFPPPQQCVAASGHLALAFNASDLPESLEAGRIVHAVALFDPTLPYFLPHPVEGSTRVSELNLYLARPGEDARELRAAFDPAAGPDVGVPLAAVGLGLVWAVWRLGDRGSRP